MCNMMAPSIAILLGIVIAEAWHRVRKRKAMRLVFVELGKDGYIARIFKNRKAFLRANTFEVIRPYAIAVGSIREQVIARAGNVCDRCGEVLTAMTGEMHETIPRSKGGEISLANCEWLCHGCHQGRRDSAHGNRRTHFGERVEVNSS